MLKLRSMLSYVIHSEEIEQILKIAYDVLHIGVSFYDKDFNELGFIFKGRLAPYCSCCRKNRAFLANCKKSDRENFEIARNSGKIQVYRCHAGLIDGIVPLFDEQRHFLGGLIFGQVRPESAANPYGPKEALHRLYEELPQMSIKKMMHIGQLLKLMTELIVNKHMVEFRKLGWVAQVQQYIDANIHSKITLDNIAELVGKSPSFITHHFREDFGLSLSEYIKKRRMELAIELLEQGLQVTQVARQLGYYDAYHFSKAFKKYHGKSPKDFKKF